MPKSRWDRLVYLHGLLEREPDEVNLNSLVLTSGDFGLAYLNERWAARFVAELFRNYTVCFVGYSIDDPVLRYMMDALAADRVSGETPPEAFAFGCHSKNREDECANEWQAAGGDGVWHCTCSSQSSRKTDEESIEVAVCTAEPGRRRSRSTPQGDACTR